MTLPTITEDRIALSPGDEVILRYCTWQDYENLLIRRAEQAGLKIRYNAATQEIRIMAPLPKHGHRADLLADLVKTLLRHEMKDWQAFTPITLQRRYQQGLEPDYCFYIQNYDRILGVDRIDLERDPPPDLALEIDLTSVTTAVDYQGIGALELWIYRQSDLLIYQFDGQLYQETQTSLQFPNWDVKTLMPRYLDRGWQVGSSVALREFEQCLRMID